MAPLSRSGKPRCRRYADTVSQAIGGLHPTRSTTSVLSRATASVRPPPRPTRRLRRTRAAGIVGLSQRTGPFRKRCEPETGVPFSLQLPECRAYEMVSPPLKNGAPLTRVTAQAGAAGSIVSRLGAEGPQCLINSTGIWPGAEQPANNNLLTTAGGEAVRYRCGRRESGWGFKPSGAAASNLQI